MKQFDIFLNFSFVFASTLQFSFATLPKSSPPLYRMYPVLVLWLLRKGSSYHVLLLWTQRQSSLLFLNQKSRPHLAILMIFHILVWGSRFFCLKPSSQLLKQKKICMRSHEYLNVFCLVIRQMLWPLGTNLTVWCFVSLQPCLSDTHVQSYQDESYVPMNSPSAPTTECDGYIPMSPRTLSFLGANCSVESSPSLSSLTCQPAEFVPPPVHRHLKPRPRKGEPTWPDWGRLNLENPEILIFNSTLGLKIFCF